MEIPKKYVRVCMAGKGAQAEVHLCLPESAIGKTSTKPYYVQQLKAQLVAVKIYDPNQAEFGTTHVEVETLQQIEEQLKDDTRISRIIRLIDHDPDHRPGKPCEWIALSTSPGCFSLMDLWKNSSIQIPQELILHIFIQGTEALGFLQETCNPPILQHDVKFGNVLLYPAQQDVAGFPNIVLIDFGAAGTVVNASMLNFDRREFYALLSQLAKFAEDPSKDGDAKSSNAWQSFVAFLRRCSKLSAYTSRQDLKQDEAWEQFGEMAIQRRAKTSKTTLQSLSAMITSIATGKEKEIDEGICKVIESAQLQDHAIVRSIV